MPLINLILTELCGNGVLDAGEECESLTAGGSLTLGCSDSCKCLTEFSYQPSSPLTSQCQHVHVPICGDFQRDAGEECDGTKGCNSTCHCTNGYTARPTGVDCEPPPIVLGMSFLGVFT